MLQYPHLPHLPPLMTQLGQSGANAAQPYYFMGGGSSVRGPSMLSVQATCSMRLPPSTAQQLAAPGVPPRTQLPPASLASTATAAAAPLPAADHAALIDPFTRPHAALVEQQPPAELQPQRMPRRSGARFGNQPSSPRGRQPPEASSRRVRSGAGSAAPSPIFFFFFLIINYYSLEGSVSSGSCSCTSRTLRGDFAP
jgi:hypothetical protein